MQKVQLQKAKNPAFFKKHKLKNYFKNIFFFNNVFIIILKKKYQFRKKLNTKLKLFDYKQNTINKKIELSFFNKTRLITARNSIEKSLIPIWFKKESYFNLNSVNFFIKKELILIKFLKKKQFFFALKDLILNLHQNTLNLIKNNNPLQNKLAETKNYFAVEKKNIYKFHLQYFSIVIFNEIVFKKNVFKNSLNCYHVFLKNSFSLYNNTLYINLLNKTYRKFLKRKEIFYLFNSTKIVNNQWISTKNTFISVYPNSINTTLRQQKLKSILIGNSLIKNRTLIAKFLKKSTFFKLFLWKKNNSFFYKNSKKKLNRRFFPLPEHSKISPSFKNINKNSLNIIKRHNRRVIVSKHLIYILIRLEEKIDFYAEHDKTKNLTRELIKFYNFIKYLIIQKLDKNVSTTLILSRFNDIFKIKKYKWKFLFLKAINFWLKENIAYFKSRNLKKNKKLNKFFKTIWKKINKSRKKIKSKKINKRKFLKISKKNFLKKSANKTKQLKISNKNELVKYRFLKFFYRKAKNLKNQKWKRFKKRKTTSFHKLFINEKLRVKNHYVPLQNLKEALTVLTNRKVKFFFINALSLSKYAFNLSRKWEDKQKRSPTRFLQTIDRDMINKYKYVAIYIKDLIRICFIGMFLKKPSFIAKFIAFQIARLPRNRKETSFIRFIIRVVKMFAAEREEILGLRIKFRGRVNRWRRTKSIIGERGVIPLHTVQNRIEYGSAQAINRKGAIGIRIWIRYKPTFSSLIRASIFNYLTYSKHLNLKKRVPRAVYFTRVKKRKW